MDIVVGDSSSLALDINGLVYAWGDNTDGQCGISKDVEFLFKPKLIDELIDYDIEIIKFGYHHGYCRSKCGKHWIWGQNDDNECLMYEQGEDEDVFSPHRIDEIVTEKAGATRIIDIYPGYYATKIICD